jgi:hypothetical protein
VRYNLEFGSVVVLGNGTASMRSVELGDEHMYWKARWVTAGW